MRINQSFAIAKITALFLLLSTCGGGRSSDPAPAPGGSTSSSGEAKYRGVLMWKGNASGNGVYSGENTLTPQNVNPTNFGRLASFNSDGFILAQPLYVANLDMGMQGVHNVVIIATERDEVLAFDADGKSTSALWKRSYLGPGVTTVPDDFGGRTSIGHEIGITGTPVIDPVTGAMYFVTTLLRDGNAEQWLRAINIKDGTDFGPGSAQIQASLPGDGPGSVNGTVSFDSSIQNQRAGLVLSNGNVLVAWGSFSDWGQYRGWLMAYNSQTLQQVAVYSPATQRQSSDDAFGIADFGGGGAFWAAGAAPSVDSNGSIFVVSADGSFNADTPGGKNYGDSVLKLNLVNNTFQVADWFSPHNRACLDLTDMEIGSGGVVLLPSDAASGRQLAITVNKEGRVYVLDRTNLGKFDPNDAQVPQALLISDKACAPDIRPTLPKAPHGCASMAILPIGTATSTSDLQTPRFASTSSPGHSAQVPSLRRQPYSECAEEAQSSPRAESTTAYSGL